MNSNNDFWLIDSNFVGVIRFYKDYSDKSNAYMLIEEGIIMGIHGENPPLMKTRKKIVIEEARILWQKLLNEGWQKTNKMVRNFKIKLLKISENKCTFMI